MPVVSARRLDNRLSALRQANEVRSKRAKLKQALRQEDVRPMEVLATPPDYLATAEVFELLVAVPKVGPVKANRLLTMARVSRSKTIGGLSDRQRACLIDLLTRRTEPPTPDAVLPITSGNGH